MPLKIKKLAHTAKLPVCEHPGEDLGFDIFACEDIILYSGITAKVHTGVAAQYVSAENLSNFGLIVKDRSSMAVKGITVSAGIIDQSYTGEIIVLMTLNKQAETYQIRVGDKIAQLIPIPIYTGVSLEEVSEFVNNTRGNKGFGSSGT